MSSVFDPVLSLSQFQLPPQDIKLLSFCESNKLSKLQLWVEELKLTQVNAASVALYRATPEIVRLKTDVKCRFDMLQSVWDPIQQSLTGLSKEFLQQPLILPAKARNAALIAQALQKHLVDGYTICAVELVGQRKLKSGQQDILLRSIARALSAISIIVFRAYQLYANVPTKLWLRAHVLFQLAEYYDLHQERLPAGTHKDPSITSIRDIYVHLLAIACCRPNQLSQTDIAKAYQGLTSWAKHVTLLPSATDEEENIYLVDLSEDSGPLNKSRFAGPAERRVLELDFRSLVSQLSKTTLGKPASSDWNASGTVVVPQTFSNSLVAHILDCWGNSSMRNQDRQRCDIAADACVGMIDCHYHLCGSVPFQEFLTPGLEPSDSDFLSGGFDKLVSSLTKTQKDLDTQAQQRQTVFGVYIQNVSAGGYCLLWRGELPNKIEAGELIGLRETGRRAWSIGVIRWVRQLKDASQLGIQLLTNQPVPYGAAATYDMGGYSDYMRAIHIPAPMMPDQPPTLLTAPMPFQEHSRVKLKQDDQNVDVRLKECVFSTSKLKMFSFDTLNPDTE